MGTLPRAPAPNPARGWRPSALLPCMGAPPHTPGGFMRGRWPLPPLICRRSALHPGDFPVAGKVTKGAPEPTVLDSLGAEPSPSLVLRCACTRATFCHKNRPICHFELVGKSVLFFPLVSSREHSLFSIRGAAGALSRGCLRVLFPATNTARAEGRGIKGGYAPFAGGQEFSELQTRRSLVSLW